MGAALALSQIYGGLKSVDFPTLFAILSLIPAILLYPIAFQSEKSPKEILSYLKFHSSIATVLALSIIVLKLLHSLDFCFVLLVLP